MNTAKPTASGANTCATTIPSILVSLHDGDTVAS